MEQVENFKENEEEHHDAPNVVRMYSSEEEDDNSMVAESFGCYKWDSFGQDVKDFFGGDKTILIGCYKNKKYLDWISSHRIYTIRLGKTKGSMEEYRPLFESVSLLVLYHLEKPSQLSVYKITDHKELTKEELIGLDYPNPIVRKNHMGFCISSIDMDVSYLEDCNLIEKLIQINSENEKGKPVFIEP